MPIDIEISSTTLKKILAEKSRFVTVTLANGLLGSDMDVALHNGLVGELRAYNSIDVIINELVNEVENNLDA